MMRPISNREEYVGLRNKPANVEHTQLARMGNPEAKRKMLQFCYSCMPAEGGKLKGSKTPSNSVRRLFPTVSAWTSTLPRTCLRRNLKVQ